MSGSPSKGKDEEFLVVNWRNLTCPERIIITSRMKNVDG